MSGYRPRGRIWTAAAPAGAIVPLADIKAHLRVTDDHEDDDIIATVAAAVQAVETGVQQLLSVRTAVLRLPDLPSGQAPVELPGGPVAAVTSVIVDGQAVSGAVALGHSPAVLIPAADWPVTTGVNYPVVITYTVGHATVPPDLLAAVKMLAAHWHEHKEAVVVGAAATPLPMGVQHLIGQRRVTPV